MRIRLDPRGQPRQGVMHSCQSRARQHLFSLHLLCSSPIRDSVTHDLRQPYMKFCKPSLNGWANERYDEVRSARCRQPSFQSFLLLPACQLPTSTTASHGLGDCTGCQDVLHSLRQRCHKHRSYAIVGALDKNRPNDYFEAGRPSVR